MRRSYLLGAVGLACAVGAAPAAQAADFKRLRNYDNDPAGVDQYAYGWVAQLGYMIPGPWIQEHLEIAARVEQSKRGADGAARLPSRLANRPEPSQVEVSVPDRPHGRRRLPARLQAVPARP